MKILRILPLLLCLPFLSLRAQQEQYIVHSSGLVLGYSASDSRAVILSSTDKAVRPLTIEKSGNYVLLKNQQTGKYLGTDATTAGSSCFSDKSGTDAKHRWRLSDTPNPAPIVDTYKYIINIDAVLGDASGFPITEEFLKEMNETWF